MNFVCFRKSIAMLLTLTLILTGCHRNKPVENPISSNIYNAKKRELGEQESIEKSNTETVLPSSNIRQETKINISTQDEYWSEKEIHIVFTLYSASKYKQKKKY